MKKFIKRIIDLIVLIFTGRGSIADKYVDEGILDFSGQGRNSYGR